MRINIFGLVVLVIVSTYSATATSDSIKHMGKGLSLHKEMYIMPVSWADEYQEEEAEAVFQLSVKQKAFNTQFYFAYTQKSFWQAYNTEESSPFRETNYNPEIFYRFRSGYFSSWGLGNSYLIQHLGADFGFEHESNGQTLPLSRSWNRFYFTPSYSNDNLLLQLKLSFRLHEDGKENPGDTKGDDNPDITDYYGYSELHIYQQFYRDHLVHLMARGNGVTKKGAIELSYSVPGFYGNTFYMIRAFHGYGDSLIDYNNSITRIGIGIMIAR